jgi:hypothetical protein
LPPPIPFPENRLEQLILIFWESSVTKIIAGIKVPDSKLAKEVEQLVRDTETDLLFHHSNRVFLFGALTGQRKGLHVDSELLYVGRHVSRHGPSAALR